MERDFLSPTGRGSTFWFKKFLAIVFSGLDQALNLALGQMLPRSILSIGLADWVMSLRIWFWELRSSQLLPQLAQESDQCKPVNSLF